MPRWLDDGEVAGRLGVGRRWLVLAGSGVERADCVGGNIELVVESARYRSAMGVPVLVVSTVRASSVSSWKLSVREELTWIPVPNLNGECSNGELTTGGRV